MRYLSVCSGIEAATVAWHPLGWEAAAYSEIEKFPRAVLQHHYPEVPLHGDFTTIQGDEYGPVDLLVGGTPCQSFSVAGLRGGLDDPRGNLALGFLQLARRTRARWVVWENVPGVLSSDGGRDFGSILGGLAELGYGWAYRVLDAQFFGVAQRRRRVFVVGYLGDWRRAAAVLFERHGLSGNPPPSRSAIEVPTRTLAGGARKRGGFNYDDIPLAAVAFGLRNDAGRTGLAKTASVDATGRSRLRDAGFNPIKECAPTLDASAPHAVAFAIQERATSENPAAGPDGAGFRNDGAAYTLEARGVPQAVAFALRGRAGGAMPEVGGDVSNALRTPGGGASVPMVAASAVRRLTPRECERLQGFADDYTLIPWRNGMAPDGPRYKALGNSMAVPCMSWIGQRIQAVEDHLASRARAA